MLGATFIRLVWSSTTLHRPLAWSFPPRHPSLSRTRDDHPSEGAASHLATVGRTDFGQNCHKPHRTRPPLLRGHRPRTQDATRLRQRHHGNQSTS
ncbi:hypothetical protein BKA80DRAFT_82828 [Phyllosticta citrichinensis]